MEDSYFESPFHLKNPRYTTYPISTIKRIEKKD